MINTEQNWVETFKGKKMKRFFNGVWEWFKEWGIGIFLIGGLIVMLVFALYAAWNADRTRVENEQKARKSLIKQAETKKIETEQRRMSIERKKVYAEAVKNGVGRWVVIDEMGNTEFEWIRNIQE